jgi:predicted secreted Zn-dependent protease
MFEPVLAQFGVGWTIERGKNIYSKRQNSAYYISGKTGAGKIERHLNKTTPIVKRPRDPQHRN